MASGGASARVRPCQGRVTRKGRVHENARRILGGIILVLGCADVAIRKVPNSSDYESWSDYDQRCVDNMCGLRFYRTRPYVVVKKPFVVSSKPYLVAAMTSIDGKFVRIVGEGFPEVEHGIAQARRRRGDLALASLPARGDHEGGSRREDRERFDRSSSRFWSRDGRRRTRGDDLRATTRFGRTACDGRGSSDGHGDAATTDGARRDRNDEGPHDVLRPDLSAGFRGGVCDAGLIRVWEATTSRSPGAREASYWPWGCGWTTARSRGPSSMRMRASSRVEQPLSRGHWAGQFPEPQPKARRWTGESRPVPYARQAHHSAHACGQESHAGSLSDSQGL